MPAPLIAGAIAIGKIAGTAFVGEMVSRGLKELEELYKGKGALDKQQAKNRLKEMEYATATKAQKAEIRTSNSSMTNVRLEMVKIIIHYRTLS